MTGRNNMSARFLSIVDQYQSEEGILFEQAWDKARQIYPSEWNHFVRAYELLAAKDEPAPPRPY
jgi:hypothetical protein